jgi:hypothetical protein
MRGSQTVLWEKAARETITLNPEIPSVNQKREKQS